MAARSGVDCCLLSRGAAGSAAGGPSRALRYLAGALIVWKVLMLATGSESPVVVVLSGSMEPGFYKGDMLVLNMPSPAHPVGVGDIVVFNVEDKAIPIVHR